MKTTAFKSAIKYLFLVAVFQLNYVSAQEHNHETENSLSVSYTDESLTWNPAPDFFPNCSFTLLHGEMSDPNLDLFFKIEPNTEVINHTHKSPERMILLSGDLEVQYEGEKATVVKAGSYLYGPANKPHRAKCLDNGPCVLFIALVDAFDAVPIEE